MRSIRRLFAATREIIRGVFFRSRLDAEVEEELKYHMELEAEKLRRTGLPASEAHRLAAASLGGVERHKDEVRDARGWAWLPAARLDFTLGLRMMKKHPALSVVGGIGMAVGVAMSVGMLVFIRANIYPTIPLDEGDRIVALENRDVTTNNEDRRVLHDFVTWRTELKSIEDVGAFRTVVRNVAVANEAPEPLEMAEMSASGFRLARVPAAMGRFLVDDDERADRPPVAVLGHDLWRSRFGARPDIVGVTIKIAGVTHTIVGVMPEDFGFPVMHRMWIPLRADPGAFPRRRGPYLYVFGRLAPGATLEAAQAELSTVGRRAAAQFPENAKIEPMVMPYIHSITDIQGIRNLDVMLMQMMMTLLLVVVAVNVAMLVYARTAARQGEIAVRTALGASRTRIVSQLFVEALALAICSSIAGLGIGYLGVKLGAGIMETEMGGSPFWLSYRLDPWIVLYTIAIAVFTAIIVGVIPALQATGKRLEVNLRSLGGSAPRLGKTWTALITAQVALAVAVLPATVNYAWTEGRAVFTHPTYDARQYVVAELQVEQGDGPQSGAARGRVTGGAIAEIVRRLEESPAIEDVAYRTSFAARRGPVEAEHVTSPPGTLGFRSGSYGVSTDYFDLYGLRLLAGRGFVGSDGDTAATAVIVNQAFAAKVFGTASPLGRRIRYAAVPAPGDPAAARDASRWYEIVGVVTNERVNDVAPELVIPGLYYAVSPEVLVNGESMVLDGRTREAGLTTVVPVMRRVVAAVDPTIRVGRVIQQANANRQDMIIARLLGLGLGLVLLSVFLLSAAGIYTLVAFTITRRRKEIGIRSALGATQRQVVSGVLGPVARQVAIGMVVGIAGGAAVDRAMGGELFGGRAGVLLPMFGVAMSIVALLAAFGPARRGIRVAPTEALRGEG